MNDQLTVYSLFPTPVMEGDIGRSFTKEEMDFIKECKNDFFNNVGNTTSNNTFILDHKSMKNIREFIENNIALFMEKIQSPMNEIKPYITQSWVNFTEPGQYHHKHSHPNSFISGVMYFNAEGETDKITFYNPRNDYILKLEKSSFNTFNSDSWWLPAKTGKLFLFPSKIDHEVSSTGSSETRISLAFNVFLKGVIGKTIELTELKL